MPELPEVESIKLGLEQKILNSKILDTEVLCPKIIAGFGTKRQASSKKTQDFKRSLQNKKILSIQRRAKNLIFELNDKSIFIIHLKMTGQLVFVDKKKNKLLGGHPITESYTLDLPNKHTCLIFNLNTGKLFYNDLRKFGYILYYKNLKEAISHGHFKNIGLEPFQKEFTLKYFKDALRKKNKSIKAVLLEQSVVTGSGNIYSDEICFASKVLPSRICKTLSEQEIADLYRNIKKIFKEAISMGGSSVSDYLLADASHGNYARKHKVYGRAAKKCLVCSFVLEKSIISARTTVFCRKCQN